MDLVIPYYDSYIDYDDAYHDYIVQGLSFDVDVMS